MEAFPNCAETCILHPQELFEDRRGRFHEALYLPNCTMSHPRTRNRHGYHLEKLRNQHCFSALRRLTVTLTIWILVMTLSLCGSYCWSLVIYTVARNLAYGPPTLRSVAEFVSVVAKVIVNPEQLWHCLYAKYCFYNKCLHKQRRQFPDSPCSKHENNFQMHEMVSNKRFNSR